MTDNGEPPPSTLAIPRDAFSLPPPGPPPFHPTSLSPVACATPRTTTTSTTSTHLSRLSLTTPAMSSSQSILPPPLHCLSRLVLLSLLLSWWSGWCDGQLVCPATGGTVSTGSYEVGDDGYIFGNAPFQIPSSIQAYGVAFAFTTLHIAGGPICTPYHFAVALYTVSASGLTQVATTADVVVYSSQAPTSGGQVVYIPFLNAPVAVAESLTYFQLVVGASTPYLYFASGGTTGSDAYQYTYSDYYYLPQSFTTTNVVIPPFKLYVLTCSFTATTFASPYASGHCPASIPSPGPQASGVGATYGDPYFSGFWRQLYYFHGVAGGVYSVLSDASLQLNCRLVFLSNISCPVLEVADSVHCSNHAGTYFGEMALTLRDGETHRLVTLHVVGGPVSTGFSSVTVSGQSLAVSAQYGSLLTDRSRPSLYVHRRSPRTLVVHAGLYEMWLDNSDRYVDLVQVQVSSWTQLLQTTQPTGLLGSTWNRTTTIPPPQHLYRERDNNITGCNIPTQKFCTHTQQQPEEQHEQAQQEQQQPQTTSEQQPQTTEQQQPPQLHHSPQEQPPQADQTAQLELSPAQ